ncbi:MAG: thermonuclease family protein, partial [Candidatus Micrarchaeia archaeon]
GVNTPEKGEPCYEDAKLYVESQIFGRYVDVKTFGKDKYGRTLGEVYTSGKNLNTELIRRGYANAYLGDEEINWAEYVSAEEEGYLLGGCMWEGGWKRVCVGGEWKNGGFEIVNLCNVTIDTNVTIRDTSASHRINSVLLIEPYGRIRIDESCISDNKTIGICQHIFNKDGDELIIYDKEGLVVRIPYGKYKQG